MKLQSEEGNDSICKSDDFDNQKSATVRETSPPSINEPSDCLKSVHQRFFLLYMRRCKICILEDVMGAGVVVELIRLGQGLSNTPHLHLCLRGCDASVLLSPAHLKDNAFALCSRWIS